MLFLTDRNPIKLANLLFLLVAPPLNLTFILVQKQIKHEHMSCQPFHKMLVIRHLHFITYAHDNQLNTKVHSVIIAA